MQASTTERYAHLHLDPVRVVADLTSREIAGALKDGGKNGMAGDFSREEGRQLGCRSHLRSLRK
jgi:hypothetical protein